MLFRKDQAERPTFKSYIRWVIFTTVIATFSPIVYGEETAKDQFVELDENLIAFPTTATNQSPSSLFSHQQWELQTDATSEGTVLKARLDDELITQSILKDAPFKHFAFNMERKRFEPIHQQIRIATTDKKELESLEELSIVSSVKHYPALGFSIVALNENANPVSSLSLVREMLDGQEARLLTGFPTDEPM